MKKLLVWFILGNFALGQNQGPANSQAIAYNPGGGGGRPSPYYSGLLDPQRAMDWSLAGAGTIPNRTTICQSLGTPGQTRSFAQSVTVANIQAALSACAGTGQVVFLNPGTYSLSSSLAINSYSNVSLRGHSPADTVLHFTSVANTCLGNDGPVDICMSNANPSQAIQYSTDQCAITAGIAQGSNTFTLGSWVGSSIAPFTGCTYSDLHVGSLVQLTIQDDSLTDNGNYWTCGQGPNGSTAYCT